MKGAAVIRLPNGALRRVELQFVDFPSAVKKKILALEGDA